MKDSFETLIKLPDYQLKDANPTSLFDSFSSQLNRLKKREKPDDVELLDNTLKTLFSSADIGNLIDAFNVLLSDNNETLRIA